MSPRNERNDEMCEIQKSPPQFFKILDPPPPLHAYSFEFIKTNTQEKDASIWKTLVIKFRKQTRKFEFQLLIQLLIFGLTL